MIKPYILACFVGAIGCGSCMSRPPIEDRPSLVLTVKNEANGFSLTLQNPSSYERCIVADDWPTRGGLMANPTMSIAVEEDGERHVMRDENLGHCIGDCGPVRIAAETEITAHLPYSQFPDLPKAAHSSARLVFAPRETPCDRY
ncbi:MAG: hypothetical protein K2X07_08560 [Caulobacteraceae bacterium]|nr:hypothetical protein [Caulobacteraceae bacterium]